MHFATLFSQKTGLKKNEVISGTCWCDQSFAKVASKDKYTICETFKSDTVIAVAGIKLLKLCSTLLQCLGYVNIKIKIASAKKSLC